MKTYLIPIIAFVIITLFVEVLDKKFKGNPKFRKIICIVSFCIGLILLIGMAAMLVRGSGCSKNKSEAQVINTFEETPIGLIEEYSEEAQMVTTTKYYEMSDGTWKTDKYTYKYRLEITGRLNNAARDTTYVILSNNENITFEQAWKASGLSSNGKDYFKVEDAVIVGRS